MRWTRKCRQTSGTDADGEIVWSRRPDAGVKSAAMLKASQPATVAIEHWLTEESAYKP